MSLNPRTLAGALLALPWLAATIFLVTSCGGASGADESAAPQPKSAAQAPRDTTARDVVRARKAERARRGEEVDMDDEPQAPGAPVSEANLVMAAEVSKTKLDTVLAAGATAFSVETANETAQVKAAQNAAAQWAEVALQGSLKPVQSGAGIIVGEPVSVGKNPRDLTAFGAGCTRWLHLSVGGQGEMGKTPLWSSLRRVQRELGKPNLQLSPRDITLLPRIIGVTHTVTSRIENKAGTLRCTLTLQLWRLSPNGAPATAMGTPITVSGSRDEIVKQLPSVAQRLSGAFFKRAFGAVKASPDDLSFLGKLPFNQGLGGRLPSADVARLESLARHIPLAGVLWVNSAGIDAGRLAWWQRVVSDLVRLSPDNALVLSALEGAPQFLEAHRAVVEAFEKRNPNNFAMTTLEASRSNQRQDTDAQLKNAERAVAAAPQNPLAWTNLEKAFYDKSDSIRRKRTWDRMNPAEQAAVTELYPHALMAALQSTRLDPDFAFGWRRVATEAIFNGDDSLGDIGLRRALKLDPSDPRILRWGLQMYQPKWSDEPGKLLEVGRIIASNPRHLRELAWDVLSALRDAGRIEEASAWMLAALSQLHLDARRQPRDPQVIESLASLNRSLGNYPEAAKAYETWMALEPDNTVPISSLADMCLNQTHDDAKLESLLLRGMELEPKQARWPRDLADYYKNVKHDPERAAPLLRRATSLDATVPDATVPDATNAAPASGIPTH